MDALSLLAVVCFVIDVQDVNTRYPSYETCSERYTQAGAFAKKVSDDLSIFAGWQPPSWDGGHALIGGGLHGQYLLSLRGEALRLQAIWYELWWVVDKRQPIKDRFYHRDVVRAMIGDRAFVTGMWPNHIPIEMLPRE